MDHGYAVNKSIYEHTLWEGKRPLLSSLDIELTERCNNACIHCYINLPENHAVVKQRELSTHEWKQILHQATDLGALSIRITGGEPLLRPDFSEIYIYARQLGMKVLLYTNARRITLELAKLFARIPPLKKIEISVYGMSAETYDAIACAPGAYDEFRRGVKLLLEYDIPFIVKGALLPQFESEIDEFEAWAMTIPWMDEPPSYSMFLDLRAHRDSEPKNKLIHKLRIEPENGISRMKRRSDRYHQELTQFCSRFIGPDGKTLFNCGAGLGGCVNAYGMFQPCMMLRSPELSYDLRTGSLRDALVEFFPTVRSIEAENPNYLKRCARCFLHGLCEQCPAKSWSEHGDLDTPVEYLCQIAHVRARDLGLLSDRENAWEVADWQARINKLEAK